MLKTPAADGLGVGRLIVGVFVSYLIGSLGGLSADNPLSILV